jgi:hypothetical protein
MVGNHKVRNAIQVLKDIAKTLDETDRQEALKRIEDINSCFDCMQNLIRALLKKGDIE